MKLMNFTRIKEMLVAGCLLISSIQVSAQMSGLTISGIPENTTTGASWTYQGTTDNVFYSLQGILMKPQGDGPFPAVIINHGTGGNFNGYSKAIAQEMVTWGFVCIATNYTHAGGAPSCGLPGECITEEYGGSPNNILRGMKCWDILASLSYVQENCIYAFGHSRGAFLTTAMVAAHPGKFRAAGHTAGGILPVSVNNIIPDVAAANNITCPYIIHHGTSDNTVPLSYDVRLDSLFDEKDLSHMYFEYPEYSHSDVSFDQSMFVRTMQFFYNYGCAQTTPIQENEQQAFFTMHPNPASSMLTIKHAGNAQVILYDQMGKEILITSVENEMQLDLSEVSEGLYWCVIRSMEGGEFSRKLMIRR